MHYCARSLTRTLHYVLERYGLVDSIRIYGGEQGKHGSSPRPPRAVEILQASVRDTHVLSTVFGPARFVQKQSTEAICDCPCSYSLSHQKKMLKFEHHPEFCSCTTLRFQRHNLILPGELDS